MIVLTSGALGMKLEIAELKKLILELTGLNK